MKQNTAFLGYQRLTRVTRNILLENMFERICRIAILVTFTVRNPCYVESQNIKQPEMIYILLWTKMQREPFKLWKHHNSFATMHCEYQNCFICKNRDFFDDVTSYDVILFNSIDLTEKDLPIARSDNQIYVFVSTESVANYPQHTETFNYFFNYTWTYKFNSDIIYPYFIVRHKLRRGKVLGPGERMHWMNNTKMKPVAESIKNRLRNKTVAAAWFVTNCLAINRLNYAHALNVALNKYNLRLDIYGACGYRRCLISNSSSCFSMIESDYYFYLSFENSFCQDYVTEKLLNALGHYAVPVVLGGADYSK